MNTTTADCMISLMKENLKLLSEINRLELLTLSACELAGKDEDGKMCYNAHDLAVRCKG